MYIQTFIHTHICIYFCVFGDCLLDAEKVVERTKLIYSHKNIFTRIYRHVDV